MALQLKTGTLKVFGGSNNSALPQFRETPGTSSIVTSITAVEADKMHDSELQQLTELDD